MLTKDITRGQYRQPIGSALGGKVRCPFCHREEVSVTNSRQVGESAIWLIRRTRHCGHCRKTFHTFEMLTNVYDTLAAARSTLVGFRRLLEGINPSDDK